MVKGVSLMANAQQQDQFSQDEDRSSLKEKLGNIKKRIFPIEKSNPLTTLIYKKAPVTDETLERLKYIIGNTERLNFIVPAKVYKTLSEEIGENSAHRLIKGRGCDLGVAIEYNDGTELTNIESLVKKFKHLSYVTDKNENKVYVFIDREVSTGKTLAWGIGAVAVGTFLYNVAHGNVDFSSVGEVVKNFFVAKYQELGTFTGYHNGSISGDANLDFNSADVNMNIIDGHGTINGNYVLYDPDGTPIEIDYTNFSATGTAYPDGIQVNPDGSITLDGFTGSIDGTISGSIGGTMNGYVDGVLRGTTKIVKYFPSYLLKMTMLGIGALRLAYEKRKREHPNSIDDLLTFLEDLETKISSPDNQYTQG